MPAKICSMQVPDFGEGTFCSWLKLQVPDFVEVLWVCQYSNIHIILILQVSHFVEKNGGTCQVPHFVGASVSENHKSAPKNRWFGCPDFVEKTPC